MTEKMIDLDIVIERIASIYHRVQTPTESDYSLWFMSKDIELRNLFLHCLDDLTREIQELATPAPEPQESIFDADGWCHNMNLIPDNENVLLYVINPDLKTKRATTGVKVHKIFYFATISERDKAIAWRYLPTLPKDKS